MHKARCLFTSVYSTSESTSTFHYPTLHFRIAPSTSRPISSRASCFARVEIPCSLSRSPGEFVSGSSSRTCPSIVGMRTPRVEVRSPSVECARRGVTGVATGFEDGGGAGLEADRGVVAKAEGESRALAKMDESARLAPVAEEVEAEGWESSLWTMMRPLTGTRRAGLVAALTFIRLGESFRMREGEPARRRVGEPGRVRFGEPEIG